MRVTIEQAPGEALFAGEDIVEWRCTISGGEDEVSFATGVSRSVFGEEPPTRLQMIELLSADLATIASHPSDEDWIDEFGEAGSTIHGKREIERVARQFERAFGGQAFAMLVGSPGDLHLEGPLSEAILAA